jgi:hypothetical protein
MEVIAAVAAGAAVVLPTLALIKTFEDLYKKVKKYHHEFKNVRPDLRILRNLIVDFKFLLSETVSNVEESEKHVPLKEKDIQCYTRIIDSAKRLCESIKTFLKDHKKLARGRRGWYWKIVASWRWSQARPEIELFKWRLTSEKRNLQLLADLFQWRVCNHLLAMVRSNRQVLEPEKMQFIKQKLSVSLFDASN